MIGSKKKRILLVPAMACHGLERMGWDPLCQDGASLLTAKAFPQDPFSKRVRGRRARPLHYDAERGLDEGDS
jgi:hypothetical protein